MARTRLIRLTRRAQAALDASLDAGAVAKQGGEGVSEGVEDVRFRYNPAADVLAVEGNDDEEEILLHEMRAEEAREWYDTPINPIQLHLAVARGKATAPLAGTLDQVRLRDPLVNRHKCPG